MSSWWQFEEEFILFAIFHHVLGSIRDIMRISDRNEASFVIKPCPVMNQLGNILNICFSGVIAPSRDITGMSWHHLESDQLRLKAPGTVPASWKFLGAKAPLMHPPTFLQFEKFHSSPITLHVFSGTAQAVWVGSENFHQHRNGASTKDMGSEVISNPVEAKDVMPQVETNWLWVAMVVLEEEESFTSRQLISITYDKYVIWTQIRDSLEDLEHGK